MSEISLIFSPETKRRHSMKPRRYCGFILYGCGSSIFFIVFGILVLTLWSVIYEAILRNNLVLVPDSTAYSMWEKTPLPISLKLFLFNWTNPQDLNDTNLKPRFQQIGPYTFRESKEKVNISWNHNNNTVTYKNVKKWWYDPSQSNGSLDDTFVTINPVGLSAAYAARDWHYLLKKGLSLSLNSLVNKIHVVQPVGKVTFGGYEDPLLSMATKLPMLSKNSIPLTDKFGWFYGRNGSSEFDGIFNIETGVNGPIGQLRSWKYSNSTPYYPGHCGRVDNASGGDFFPRELTKQSLIKMFSSDLCRYMELEFEEEVVINGLIGYKYSAQDRFLDNGTKIPENRCFCDGDCMPYGGLNVSNCRHGSPAFITLPHFYKADPSYLSAIEGIVPSHDTDNLYMVFEPKTGVPLEVAARLQLNLRLQPVEGITIYEKVPTLFFPVLYFEQKVTIPDNMTFTLKLLVNFQVICSAVGIILIAGGILILIITCYKICTTNVLDRKNTKTVHIVKEEVPLKQ